MAGPASAAAGWSAVSVPHTGNNTELNAMSARTSIDAWAVGTRFGAAAQTPPPPVAYHWNGSAWSLTATPSLGVNEPSVNGGVQQGMILRWNGSTWSADTDPSAGTFRPLYGAATLPGATREWAAGINGTDQALILSHG
jgi:hypothetical protein